MYILYTNVNCLYIYFSYRFLLLVVGNIARIIYNRSYGVRGKEQTMRTLFSQCVYFVTFISYTIIMSFAVLRGRDKMKHYIEYLTTLEMVRFYFQYNFTVNLRPFLGSRP